MKNRKLFTLVGSICLILVLAALPFMAACAGPAPTPPPTPTPTPTPTPVPTPKPEPIVIKAVTHVPFDNYGMFGFKHFMEIVNERARGELIIEWVGGPEVISPFGLGRAVADGVVPMASMPMAYYTPVCPAAGAATYATIMKPTEQRASGMYDFLLEEHKKAGLYYLGRTEWGGPAPGFFLFTNIKVNRPQELTGQRFRSAAYCEPFLKALGIDIISMPQGDIYTGIERGLVDGYTFFPLSLTSFGLHEVTKYWINHSISSSGLAVIMNLDSWGRLPERWQDLLVECTIDNEKWTEENFWKPIAEMMSVEWREAGMEPIEFSAEDAKWFNDLALEVGWATFAQRFPDLAPKCREVMVKE